MDHRHHQVPIWFFIGALLTVYGVLIAAVGVYNLVYPPVHKVALWEKHADLWWGALLIVIGLVYSIRFWPWSSTRKKNSTVPK